MNVSEEFKRIEQLQDQGHFEEALQALLQLGKVTVLTDDEQLKSQLLMSIVLCKLKNFEESLQIIEKVLEECRKREKPFYAIDAFIAQAETLMLLKRLGDSQKAIIQGEILQKGLSYKSELVKISRKASFLFLRGSILSDKGDFANALEYFNHCLNLNKETTNKQDVAKTLNSIGILFLKKRELKQSLEYFQRSLVLRKEYKNKRDIASSFHNIGVVYNFKGNLEEALIYYQKSLALREELGNKRDIANSLNNIAEIHQKKGDLDQALKYFQQSITMKKKIGSSEKEISLAYNNIGVIFWQKGDLNGALDYYQLSLNLIKDQGETFGYAVALGNIGEIYQQKGELDRALEYLGESLRIKEKMGRKKSTAWSLTNLGNIYQQKGDFNQAEEYFSRSLIIYDEIGDQFWLAENLYFLTLTTVDKNSIKKAQEYLQRLKEINDKEDNKIINQRYRIAKALIMKVNPRMTYKAKAQMIFQQIVDEEIVDHEITVFAMLNLCDMLLMELKSSGNEEVISEVKILGIKLLEVAKSQTSRSLTAESYWLLARLALLELDLSKARHLLMQAQIIADEQGLKRLAMRISGEHDSLLQRVSEWEALIEHKASIRERLELVELESMMIRLLRKQEDGISAVAEEKPVLLLILSQSGISIFSRYFIPEIRQNAQLLAGLILAINAFSGEAFSVAGSIERIMHQEYTLLIKSLNSVLICYAFKGPSYIAQQKLDHFTNKIQSDRTIWAELMEAIKVSDTLEGKRGIFMDEIIDKLF